MFELLFLILTIIIFWKILKFAIKMAWGISKIVCSVILLPIILFVLVLRGLIALAVPILVITTIVSLFVFRDSKR